MNKYGMQEPTLKNFLIATALAFVGAAAVAVCCGVDHAGATQPECTGDRHLDECGQLCPVPTSTTTSTTLPGNSECPPQVSCPLPAPCQTVRCEDGADGQTVYVDRCEAPIYYPCNFHTKAKKGDMLLPDGTFAHCSRRGAKHRGFIPGTMLPYTPKY